MPSTPQMRGHRGAVSAFARQVAHSDHVKVFHLSTLTTFLGRG